MRIFKTQRRKNAGFFTDARGDCAVAHTTSKTSHYKKGTPLLITWVLNLQLSDCERFDANFAQVEGGKYYERVISIGV